jgi:putative tricarboxylic transport membrane protein
VKRFDLISSGFWLAAGVFICEESWRMKLGQFHNPGPGFLPFWAGLVLAGGALAVMAGALRRAPGEERSFWADRSRRPKVFLTLGCILVYGILLEPLGFLLTTFLGMGFLFRVIEPQRWPTVLLGALVSAVGAYLLFHTWLQVELPKGVLGI